jgi:surfeit locus 1 family protein
MPFKPSLKLTLILLLLAALFLRLGFWQLERKSEKQQLFDAFEQAPLQELGQALSGDAPFVRVEAWGRYDTQRHLLLDNRLHQGRAGVQVLTPFQLQDGRQILVNRGWLPMPPDRRSLPAFETAGDWRTITGILVWPPAGGPRLGEADRLDSEHWPQLVTYLDLEQASAALGTSLQPRLIQLDPQDPTGFEGRDWQPAVMGPEVHGAYALQWFSLALAALIIWLALGYRRALGRSGTKSEN